jgi:hypothetical protein
MPNDPQPFGPNSPPCPHCGSRRGISNRVMTTGHATLSVDRDGKERLNLISTECMAPTECLCVRCHKIRTDVTWPEEE